MVTKVFEATDGVSVAVLGGAVDITESSLDAAAAGGISSLQAVRVKIHQLLYKPCSTTVVTVLYRQFNNWSTTVVTML